MASKQKERPIEVTSPLGEDTLLFRRMTGVEELGRLFRYDLELLSEDPAIVLHDVLGQSVTVRLNLAGDETRHFNGYVTDFSQVGALRNYTVYRATLRPWLWFLTRTTDCRIFQGKTVPEIIKAVFRELGFTDFEESLSGSYRTWDYCVQYRETDFNFVSRLMEQEGIYYYFKHVDGKHTLVLADSHSAHESIPAGEISFYVTEDKDLAERDHLFTWQISRQIQPGKYVLNDFDFEKPRASLEAKSAVSRDNAQSEYEMFDFPGEYLTTGEGEAYARVRIEELQAQYEVVEAQSNCRTLACGKLFKVDDHPRDDQKREYLIVAAHYDMAVGGYESGTPAEQVGYQCGVRAIDNKQPYRTQRSTPKPVVQGPQTAVIVGKSGEKVWTDKYGRVKVQFPWDRYGKSDENSSCWIRVSQNWAGKNWGGMFLPHLGQEVIVEFLEGDPDRPIVTGRVYNADNMPPLPLPDDRLKSIIRDVFVNQIVFDATPGAEHIVIHSPHYQSTMEIGKSVRWKSEDPTMVYSDKDWFEVVSGVKGTIAVGGDFKYTVGLGIEFTVGYKFSGQWGGKSDWFKGDASANFQGNSVEFVKGVKVSQSDAAELKINAEGFAQRSNKDMTLDTLQTCCLNAGPKDNSLIKLDQKAILLDFGEDAKEAPTADHTKAAIEVRDSVKNKLMTMIKGSAGVAIATLATDAASKALFPVNDKNQLPTGYDMGTAFTNIGVVGAAGTAWTMAKSAGLDQAIIDAAVEDTKAYNSKTTQDKTWARVKLFEDGVQILAFQGGDPKGEPTSVINVFKDGQVVVKGKGGMKILTDGEMNLKAKGDVTIEGSNINLKASAKVTSKPMIEMG